MRSWAWTCIVALLLAGCGGGGGGSSVPAGGGGNNNNNNGGSVPASTSTLFGSNSTLSTTVGIGGTNATLLLTSSGTSGSVTFTAANSAPTNVSSKERQPLSASGVLYVSITNNAATEMDFKSYPTISITTSVGGVAVFDSLANLWNYSTYCPTLSSAQACASGTTFSSSDFFSIPAGGTVYFAFYTGTPSNPEANLAFQCPTSHSVYGVVRAPGRSGEMSVRALPHQAVKYTSNLARIAVQYDRASFQRGTASFTRNEQSAGGTLINTLDYPALGRTIRVLSVPKSQLTTAMASLRTQTGVLSVSQPQRRSALVVTTAVFPNNPYFIGFLGATGYRESSTVPGQWDMHAIGMENAFAYIANANVNSGAGPSNAGAQGLASVKLAIIDTGADATHPLLSGGKIVHEACFITDPGGVQHTGSFATDPQGHGTDVTGIAAASLGVGMGFIGSGGNTSIIAERVFPTPDDNCATDATAGNDFQCGADTTDIASAIGDAIAAGAKVISMSLGGGGCTGGTDSDQTEQTAVSNALNSGVVVVAASGNEFGNAPDAPGCITGVISVGATSLDDGQPNGSLHTGGTSGSPVEYVASYSNAGATIVAPGGDPAGPSDTDNLHWIENIWTSTPYQAYTGDANFAGECTDDYPNSMSMTPPVDCRILIAGTSMATPHVAGVAALVCAVKPSDCTPANMASVLCTYAHNIADPKQGCGRLNAYAVMAHEVGDGTPPPP